MRKTLTELDRKYFNNRLHNYVADSPIGEDAIVYEIQSTLPELFSISREDDSIVVSINWRVKNLEHEIGLYLLAYVLNAENNLTKDGFITCLTKGIYGKSLHLPKLRIVKPIKSGWHYWSNSCYVDSLLAAMFLGSCSYYRNELKECDPYKLTYKLVDVCKPGSKLCSQSQIRQAANTIKEGILADIDAIQSGEMVKCVNVRKTMAQFIPEMNDNQSFASSSQSSYLSSRSTYASYDTWSSSTSSGGRWPMYEPISVYALLCDLFPAFKGRVTTFRNNNVRSAMLASFELADYIIGEHIIWDAYDSPVLVFLNGGAPAITDFTNTGEEEVLAPEYKGGRRVITRTKVTKLRKLSMTILNKRYRLFAAIMLSGTVRGHEGGAHFTAYIRTGHRFVYYDDLLGTFKPTKIAAVQTAFFDKGRLKPNMYFYERV